jgi:hypothetical protein
MKKTLKSLLVILLLSPCTLTFAQKNGPWYRSSNDFNSTTIVFGNAGNADLITLDGAVPKFYKVTGSELKVIFDPKGEVFGRSPLPQYFANNPSQWFPVRSVHGNGFVNMNNVDRFEYNATKNSYNAFINGINAGEIVDPVAMTKIKALSK